LKGAQRPLRPCLNPPDQHENDYDDQDGADKPDATVAITVTVAAEAAAEAAEQKYDEEDDKDKSQRHGLSPSVVNGGIDSAGRG
jgi:hypothetical protein